MTNCEWCNAECSSSDSAECDECTKHIEKMDMSDIIEDEKIRPILRRFRDGESALIEFGLAAKTKKAMGERLVRRIYVDEFQELINDCDLPFTVTPDEKR